MFLVEEIRDWGCVVRRVIAGLWLLIKKLIVLQEIQHRDIRNWNNNFYGFFWKESTIRQLLTISRY